MANKDDDLVLSVGAEANVDSAKKATKDLEKGVLSSLKDGYIPVPVELKTPIKGASKELKAAQEEVVAQWEKTFSKGFSSSKKNLDNLTNAYQKFKRLASGERKTTSKQYRGIFHMMDNQVQDYKAKRKDTKVTPPKEARTAQTKNIRTKSLPTGTARRKGKYSDIKSVTKGMDYPTRSTDMSTTTKDLVEASDRRGPYRSRFNEQIYRSQAEERANERKSLKISHIDNYNKERFRIKESKFKSHTVSDEEANKGLAKISRDDIRNALVNLFKGMDDLPSFLATLPESIKNVVGHNEKAGVDLDKTIVQLSNVVASYAHSLGGRLGVNYDDDASVPKSERSYLDNMDAALRAILEYAKKLQNVKDKNGLDPEVERQLGLLGGTFSKKWDKQTGKVVGKKYYGLDEKEANKIINQQLAKNALKDLFGQFKSPDTAIDYNSDAMKAIDKTATKLKTAGGVISEATKAAQKKLSGIVPSSGPDDGGNDPYQKLTQAISQLGYYLRDIKDSIDKIAEGKRWRS